MGLNFIKQEMIKSYSHSKKVVHITWVNLRPCAVDRTPKTTGA